MNRLWVRLSFVIGCIVVFTFLFPWALRGVGLLPEQPKGPRFEQLSEEQISRFRADVEKRTWAMISRVLLIGAGISLLAGVLVSRWLVAPLSKLEQGAEAISKHQLDHRVPVRGSQEMRSVAHSFNQMAIELENAEELRKNMLADVTHELRHPIHTLQGNLQAILDGVYSLKMEEIARLLDQTQHLAILVNDLHELAQAEAQQLPLHKQETDLKDLVSNTAGAFEPLITGKGISLQTNLPPETLMSFVDAARIRQVLQNLLSNALRYTPVEGTITVSLVETDDAAVISVQDTGAGISPERLPHVFDRFYHADTSRNREHGRTGLGLAIALAIVQAHGGQIEAFSQGENQGSTFTIRL